MFRRPRVVGLTLCDGMGFPPPDGKPSLIGIFQARHFKRFPSPKIDFTVYFALFDGVGEGIIRLVITQLETEEDIWIIEEKVNLPGRGMHRNCLFQVRGCIFPSPGNYALTIRLRQIGQEEGEDLSHRYLDVFQI